MDYDPGLLPDSVIQNDRITEMSLSQLGQMGSTNGEM